MTFPDWVDPDAEPNGIGPICRHCGLLIDWHPFDHADDCPERGDQPRPARDPVSEYEERQFTITVKWKPLRDIERERVAVDYIVKRWTESFDDGGLGRRLADDEVAFASVRTEPVIPLMSSEES